MNTELALRGDSGCLENAAIWLRGHLKLDDDCTIFPQFEQEFNCRIIAKTRDDPWLYPDWVEFKSSEELMMFVLRWS